jgi:hypothetical protein
MDFVAWCGQFLEAVRTLQDTAPANEPARGPEMDEMKEELFSPEADRPGFWQTSRAKAIRAAMGALEGLGLLKRDQSDPAAIHLMIPEEKRALLEDRAGLPTAVTRDVPRLNANEVRILRLMNALSERQEVDHAYLESFGISEAAQAIASEFGLDAEDPETKRWSGRKIYELQKAGLVANTTYDSGGAYWVYGDGSVFQATYRGLALGPPPQSGPRVTDDSDATGSTGDTRGPIAAESELRGEPGGGSAPPNDPGSDEAVAGARPLGVFLCHSSGDKEIVRTLYRRLSEDRLAPWLDEEDLLPGQHWQSEIPKAVRAADVVLVCLSRALVKKTGYIQKEIKFVLDRADEQPPGSIYLIPLRLEECDVPERLQGPQWVDYFRENGYERLVASLGARAREIGAALPRRSIAAPGPR